MYDKISIQKNYANHLASRVKFWTPKSYSPYLANFRCDICGDSGTKKFKKRAYIIEKNGSLMFTCHNSCGNISFDNYLKENHNDLYSEYKFEIIKDYYSSNNTVTSNKNPLEEVDILTRSNFRAEEIKDVKLPLFDSNEGAYKYISDRNIPSERLTDIYYADNFAKFINSIVPNKFSEKSVEVGEPRIVFPMRWFDGTVFGYIGRTLNKNSDAKYLTVKIDENKPKIFGLDRVNRMEIINVVEGPIDSFFIDNGVALAGTDGDPLSITQSKDNINIILDNQPRSPDVIKKYEKYIKNGFRVFIWPEKIKSKDINDAINDGIKRSMINDLIKKESCSGLTLHMKFTKWRKI